MDGGESQILNCGYGRGFSVKEVVDTVKEVTGIDFRVEDAPRREGDPPALIADNRKIIRTLDWKPLYDDIRVIVSGAFEWEKTYKEKFK
jgi:UDP-glucose 4-epimerase